MFSTMTTAPSMMSPKSTAPKLTRLPESFCLRHPRGGEEHVTSFLRFPRGRDPRLRIDCTWLLVTSGTTSIGRRLVDQRPPGIDAVDVCQDVEGIEHHISRCDARSDRCAHQGVTETSTRSSRSA